MNWSQDFTVKSNARRAARKAGIDPSTVQTVVKAGQKVFRFALDAPKPKAAAAAKPAAKKAAPKAKTAKPAPKAAGKAKASRGKSGLKFTAVAALLRRPGGASITEVVAATGWKPHSARARISVDVSKLLAKGETIERRREDGISHYAIVPDKQMDLPGVDKDAA